jgi:hypothetical protein
LIQSLNQRRDLKLVLLCELLGRGIEGVMASAAQRDTVPI